jgi:hypothetical protein
MTFKLMSRKTHFLSGVSEAWIGESASSEVLTVEGMTEVRCGHEELSQPRTLPFEPVLRDQHRD